MSEEAAAHHLLNVLEERDLSVDLDAILAIFESDETKTQAAAWVNEYLNEETLLTKEELELYESLKERGILAQYENDDQPIRPMLDHELSSAINSLQSSTAVIEEQCKVLEAQQDALMALKALDKSNLSVEHMRNERRRREAQEKARLDIAVKEVTISITEQLDFARREIEVEKNDLKAYITQRLSSDDKMLAALPNIVAKLTAEPEVHEDENSIEQFCQAIISYRTAEIKTKIDTTYLENLTRRPAGALDDVPEEELKARKEALKNELDTLHSEIAAVNEMVVDHELRKPIVELKGRKEREREQTKSAWFNYSLSTLDYMSKRLKVIDDRAKQINDYQTALEKISEAASKRVDEGAEQALSTPKKRAASPEKAVFSPLVALKPAKKVEIPQVVEDALRYAGISFNPTGIETLRETLAKTQLERGKKLSEHYASDSVTTKETLADVVGKADVDLRGLIDALYTYTPFQTVHMTNQELEKRLDEKEKELEQADRDLLAAETHQISLGDPKVRAFISKWGGSK